MNSCIYNVGSSDGKLRLHLLIREPKAPNKVVIEKLMKVINEIEQLESNDDE
jgi:hypothetical protein